MSEQKSIYFNGPYLDSNYILDKGVTRVSSNHTTVDHILNLTAIEPRRYSNIRTVFKANHLV